MFSVVRPLRTSSKYTNGPSNTRRGCSIGVRFGSTSPNLLELHLSASKHLETVFYRCLVWFDSSEPLRTIPQRKQTLGEVHSESSVWFNSSEPLQTTPQHKQSKSSVGFDSSESLQTLKLLYAALRMHTEA